jgi:hypothetical protein
VVDGLVVDGLVVDGLVVDGLVVDGLVVDGLVVDGLVVDGLVVDGLVVDGLVVDGLVVDGLVIFDEVSVVLFDGLLTDVLSLCIPELPVAVEGVSHAAKPTTSIAKKMMLFIKNYLIKK